MESAFHQTDLRLIETILWDGARFPRLDQHLARLAASAALLGFVHDPKAVTRALAAVDGPDPMRVRLTLGRAGDVRMSAAALPEAKSEWRIAVSPMRLTSNDPRLRHKTTDRKLYDETRAALPKGIDEVIFLNERGEVGEGTITTVFFDLGDGICTPPLACGCLPGILRAEMLATGQAREAVLAAAELPRARLWVGNSLRGMIPAGLNGDQEG
jgi:4-amino-4-deoxychorismate lyase